MPRLSNRDKILAEGLRVVHQRGFAGASVRDIVQAAGVPQGSFTNHFASKEAFGLEVIDRYLAAHRDLMDETLLNEGLPPLQRLTAFIDTIKARLAEDDMRSGCLLGNFAIDSSDHSEAIRQCLVAAFAEVGRSFARCLEAARAVHEVPADVDCEETAAFIVAALQGAMLIAKAERSPAPLDRLKQILFTRILR